MSWQEVHRCWSAQVVLFLFLLLRTLLRFNRKFEVIYTRQHAHAHQHTHTCKHQWMNCQVWWIALCLPLTKRTYNGTRCHSSSMHECGAAFVACAKIFGTSLDSERANSCRRKITALSFCGEESQVCSAEFSASAGNYMASCASIRAPPACKSVLWDELPLERILHKQLIACWTERQILLWCELWCMVVLELWQEIKYGVMCGKFKYFKVCDFRFCLVGKN